jgi:N-acyl-D-aspartate/D-glutamate deacylase
MLKELVEKTLLAGGDALEIEYKDGREWVTAMRGNAGVGICSMTCEEAGPLFDELEALEQKNRESIIIQGTNYVLRVREYESFGEWVYHIDIISR